MDSSLEAGLGRDRKVFRRQQVQRWPSSLPTTDELIIRNLANLAIVSILSSPCPSSHFFFFLAMDCSSSRPD
ncbi:hypothetical protein L1887_14735 [Cichorium endivia]|nr:hypothetical protein L1887_14735 [Cichorium endivia]